MINDFLKINNLPNYRLKQFNDSYYKKAISDWSELKGWSKKEIELIKNNFEITKLIVDKQFVSKNGDTIKVLFKRKADNQRIETVLMKHKDGRNTVCVSCMVGCPVNCSFCATGKMGFGGNLDFQEIIDQILYFERILRKSSEKVTNIVFMGMGEPMLNLVNVQKAIDIICDSEKIGMSSRRITISTSGYIPQFKKLVENGFRGKVAISLHAPNQQLRSKLMPVAKIFSLDQLMEALDEYVKITNKRISYEYIMIKSINDTEAHAYELAELLKNRLAHVNLIPFNPIREEKFERSSNNSLFRFKKILDEAKIPTTIRITMGDDVNAACGQLADRENRKNTTKKINI